MTDPKNERQELYTEAERQYYTLYYEELIEEQKRRERRDKLETAAFITLTVIDCLMIIAYCVARIVL